MAPQPGRWSHKSKSRDAEPAYESSGLCSWDRVVPRTSERVVPGCGWKSRALCLALDLSLNGPRRARATLPLVQALLALDQRTLLGA